MKRDATRGIVLFAAAKVLFHFWSNGLYGFHRDELATLSDAMHPAWGYVAYPPLTPMLGRIGLALFGPSPAGVRLLASLAQSIAIVLTALLARRLGGGTRAQWVAALALAISPISLGASALFQYVTFDFLWFVLMAWCVVRLIDSGDARWWMAIGAAIGLGVLTKYTIAFFVAGLVAGVLATPLRRDLRTGWLWIGVAISLAIALPHLLWEWNHDFITFEFLRSIHARDMRIGRTDHFFLGQFLTSTNLMTAPLWIAGAIALAASQRFGRYRILVWMTAVPFILFVLARGRAYYTGPLFVPFFAAGSVLVESKLTSWPPLKRHAAWALCALLLLAGAAAVPFAVPLVPPSHPFFQTISRKNSDLAEELGWPEMTREVARIWTALPPAERAQAAILCANYGEAGAIDLYGPRHGLPGAISGINSYWPRGYGNPPPRTLIVLGFRRHTLEQRFTSVTVAGRIPNPYGLENEESERPEIYVCSGLRQPWPEFWLDLRSFG